MLFWACSDNLKASDNMSHRHYPFSLLKDGKHDYSKLKKAFPNSKCKVIVKQVLRNNFKPSQPDSSEAAREAALFNKLCDVFEHMYKRHARAQLHRASSCLTHTHHPGHSHTPHPGQRPTRRTARLRVNAFTIFLTFQPQARCRQRRQLQRRQQPKCHTLTNWCTLWIRSVPLDIRKLPMT